MAKKVQSVTPVKIALTRRRAASKNLGQNGRGNLYRRAVSLLKPSRTLQELLMDMHRQRNELENTESLLAHGLLGKLTNITTGDVSAVDGGRQGILELCVQALATNPSLLRRDPALGDKIHALAARDWAIKRPFSPTQNSMIAALNICAHMELGDGNHPLTKQTVLWLGQKSKCLPKGEAKSFLRNILGVYHERQLRGQADKLQEATGGSRPFALPAPSSQADTLQLNTPA